MTIFEGYSLQIFEEAIGMVGEIRQFEGYAIAKIGPTNLVLPNEMGKKLVSFVGQRAGILRTDRDFRIRVIEASDPNKGSKPLVVVQETF